jgi:hypothetical protein
MGRIASGLVASAFLISAGKPALGFDLKDAWWDLPETASAIVAFVKDDPDFTGGFVTISSGGVLLDASWWPGDSPFLKQYRLEPGDYRFEVGSEALPVMLDPASMWFVVLELKGKTVAISSVTAGLSPEELTEQVEEGELGAPGFRSGMSYLDVPGMDLKLVVQPLPSVKERRPPPPPKG